MSLFLLAAALLFLLGTPIVICLAIIIVALVLGSGNIADIANMGSGAVLALKSFPLLAMPLFVLTGDIILHSGIAKKIVSFSRAMIGPVPGNTAIAAIMSSGMFAAISGSNAATAATVGNIMYKEMADEGYDKDFAAATCASGGVVGIIIPPSVLFIVYGVLLSISPSELFIAGVIPGLMMVAAIILVVYFVSKRRNYGHISKFSGLEALGHAWEAKDAFFSIVFALGGIYLGIFSPTEAAGMTSLLLICLTLFQRRIHFRQLPKILKGSAELMGVLGPLIALSVSLQQQFTMIGLQEYIGQLLGGHDAYTTLILIMLIIFISGMILESLPNVIIWAPVFAPIAAGLGFDPIHFGVVFMIGISIGFITPPYGLNLYVISNITSRSFMSIARKSTLFIIALIVVWWIVMFFPQFSLVLLHK